MRTSWELWQGLRTSYNSASCHRCMSLFTTFVLRHFTKNRVLLMLHTSVKPIDGTIRYQHKTSFFLFASVRSHNVEGTARCTRMDSLAGAALETNYLPQRSSSPAALPPLTFRAPPWLPNKQGGRYTSSKSFYYTHCDRIPRGTDD